MPELPEVETVCRIMRRVLVGDRIVGVDVANDEIVLGGVPSSAIRKALLGRQITEVGRKGKYWWLAISDGPYLFGHLGMSGWIRELGQATIRLQSHGSAALDGVDGLPKFLKLLIVTEAGGRIAFTDGRRLGRLWLGESPETDSRIQKLGFDVLDELPEASVLAGKLSNRKVTIKGVLLDQSVFAGVGNWIADEVLFQARISPHRLAQSLSNDEVVSLRESLMRVISLSVSVGADHEQYPETWLFNSRWGGSKGESHVMGMEIVRETVAGRTTAWVPSVQV